MTATQRYWWKIALELKLRKCSGDAFQDFFSLMMSKVHGEDFVRVRPFGSLGDKGCDGYLQSSGQVFQCYGALNGNSSKVSYLVAKMEEDYAKAVANMAAIMREWHMAHNLIDGLPIEAVGKLEELRKMAPRRKLGFIGIEGFEERIFSLAVYKIEDLLGATATDRDAQNLQTADLRDLIASVAEATDEPKPDVATIKPVPADKVDFNQLPGHWRSMLMGGWQNAHLVGAYLDRHPDPLTGERIAQAFRVRYQYLKNEGLAPGAIMTSLYEMVTGIGNVPVPRAVAAQAILAFLFESCDIFEDEPVTVKS